MPVEQRDRQIPHRILGTACDGQTYPFCAQFQNIGINMGLLLILGICLFAGVVSGVIGTGSSIMLVPVLAHVYLEMTLMNFDYGGTVNFFAIIIGN
jgi:hypothetical protein